MNKTKYLRYSVPFSYTLVDCSRISKDLFYLKNFALYCYYYLEKYFMIFLISIAQGKTRTYNKNSFNVSLYQLSYLSLNFIKYISYNYNIRSYVIINSILNLEILRIELRFVNCKTTILPIKLYPLLFIILYMYTGYLLVILIFYCNIE